MKEIYIDKDGKNYMVETEGKIKLVQYDESCYNVSIVTDKAFVALFGTFEKLGEL